MTQSATFLAKTRQTPKGSNSRLITVPQVAVEVLNAQHNETFKVTLEKLEE